MYGALCRGSHGSDDSIETGAETNLEQAQRSLGTELCRMQLGAVSVDVERFGIGPLYRVVMLVEIGYEERSRAIVSTLHLKPLHSVGES